MIELMSSRQQPFNDQLVSEVIKDKWSCYSGLAAKEGGFEWGPLSQKRPPFS